MKAIALFTLTLTLGVSAFAASKGRIGEITPVPTAVSQVLLGDRAAHYLAGVSQFRVVRDQSRISDFGRFGNSVFHPAPKKRGWNAEENDTPNVYPIYLKNDVCIVYGGTNATAENALNAGEIYSVYSADESGDEIDLTLTSAWAKPSMVHVTCRLAPAQAIETLELALEKLFLIRK